MASLVSHQWRTHKFVLDVGGGGGGGGEVYAQEIVWIRMGLIEKVEISTNDA